MGASSKQPTMLSLFIILVGQASAMSLIEREETTTLSSTMYPTTHPKVPCEVHVCTEDGLFTEGPCKNTFCQCEMGHGWLQTCQEGTFFDEEMCVCNWPWNIDACPESGNVGQERSARKAFGLDGPRPRCVKMVATP